MSNATHGTARRYAMGCKCDVCTDGNTTRTNAARDRRTDRVPLVHNASTYRNWNCHCDVCTKANRELLAAKQAAAGPGVNRRKEWTTGELDVALEMKDERRYARTALQAALALGRSVAAVNRIRSLGRVNFESSNAAPGGSDSAQAG